MFFAIYFSDQQKFGELEKINVIKNKILIELACLTLMLTCTTLQFEETTII